MRREQIALQLYTLRDLMAQDYLGTLSKVAEIGYPAVELAGLGGLTAKEIRSHLDSIGLKASSAHVPYALLQAGVGAAAADIKTLGAEWINVPWIGEEQRNSLDSAKRFVFSLNELGQAVKAEGLGFAYHNHAFEFEPLPGGDGTTLWDILVAETDPAVVAIELDVYWAVYGGVDPLPILKQNPARYPLLHFKDLIGEGESRTFGPVGSGSISFQPIVATTEGTTAWYIVEQDTSNDPLADIEFSLRTLERLAS